MLVLPVCHSITNDPKQTSNVLYLETTFRSLVDRWDLRILRSEHGLREKWRGVSNGPASVVSYRVLSCGSGQVHGGKGPYLPSQA